MRVRRTQGPLLNPPGRASVKPVHPVAVAAAVAMAASAPAHGHYVPAPPKYSVVVDGGAGYDPGSTDARSIGQYADTNAMVVHTTKGFSRRQVAQDVGQLFAYQTLTPGDKLYFSRLLKTDPAYWTDLHANSPAGGSKEAGDEAFSNYYAIAATGGLKPGESIAWGNTSIDPKTLKKYTAALQRLGRRHGLRPYQP